MNYHIIMGNTITYSRSSSLLKSSITLLSLCFLLLSCHQHEKHSYTPEELSKTDSIIKANPSIDSLVTLLENYTETGNKPGMMLAYKELGKRHREATHFNEAIDYHRQGIQIATQIGDTLEIIQNLNNIGTNFRRMGILDEASTYHYKALMLCEQYSDKKSYTAKKNRLVSLNGIGNIHLTLDNRDVADSVFRAALAGEKELGSELGQAINYANIGAIFEARGMADSALIYYKQSMIHNRAAKSNLGISLCHTHLGRLSEQKGNWDDALKEYRNAYELMINDSDRWHWLESCIALARVNISKNDLPEARQYLEQAENTAKNIQSWEHLSEVHRLNYLYYKRQNNFRDALESYTQSRAYADSVKNTKNTEHMQNLRVNYEKEKSYRELMLTQQAHQMQQRNKNIFLITSLLVLLLTIAAIGFLLYALRMKSHSQKVMQYTEKIRSNFFTNITHEFRTPLTVILGLSEQLRKERVSEKEIKSALETIVRQGNNLLDLVNQLLDISKVKSEVGEPEWRTGDAIAYIRMIAESYQMYARQKQIDLRFIPAETEVVIDFVPVYFRKIIHNLLSNAIKFTPKNGLITITTSKEDQTLIVRVIDTGNGIDTEDLAHIFDIFYQGENSHENMGTGIGLSLVKQMVESMGGRVSVKSIVGKGSEFAVTLPIKHGETLLEKWIPNNTTEEPIHIPEAENVSNSSSILSILIVEDNADVSYYIGGLLKENYRLLYARNGADGLEKAKDHMPDLIITDLMMPEMDGYDLCREVRNSDILNHIPIIIITAKCEESDRIQGLNAGADAYLQKPFNTDELIIRVTKLLEQRRLLREKYSKALQEGTEQTIELNHADQDFMNRLTNVIYAQMANVDLNSDMIADKMCMSRSQLNRKMHTITGYNTSAYILQMRMERGKRMLVSSDALIGEIAMKCGFEDANYFSRIFKQIFNVTPSQYRKVPPGTRK